ncbi:MAG: class I SAM-dependent methyltransferase [Magnetococcales bacterium]|nr:class I SAM-dependent methyltransferase [Magnetococcales bacterium]NGZ29391.1 class I SAM-dependent methyltransferase [Magnetococcales bacterium]
MNFAAVRLRSWYATPQGMEVARMVMEALQPWLEDSPCRCTLGIGYTQPYMELASACCGDLFGASPAEMGVSPWPVNQDNRIALVRPDALPYPDEHFDRIFLAHFLEGVHDPPVALREIWRVMKPAGRLLVVTPNRSGLWARHDTTPFGWGRPYSRMQLDDLLQGALFVPLRHTHALFAPPFRGQRWLQAAHAWEKTGRRWFSFMGGVILCEAEKVVYATTSPIRSWHGFQAQGVPIPLAEKRPLTNQSLKKMGKAP